MSEILGNIDGADAIMDDVIMYGQSKEEHDEGIDRVLDRIQEVGFKLKRAKSKFRKQIIEHFGHMVN